LIDRKAWHDPETGRKDLRRRNYVIDHRTPHVIFFVFSVSLVFYPNRCDKMPKSIKQDIRGLIRLSHGPAKSLQSPKTSNGRFHIVDHAG
jgi:hypothetical protein